jgi:hypothetical protein
MLKIARITVNGLGAIVLAACSTIPSQPTLSRAEIIDSLAGTVYRGASAWPNPACKTPDQCSGGTIVQFVRTTTGLDVFVAWEQGKKAYDALKEGAVYSGENRMRFVWCPDAIIEGNRLTFCNDHIYRVSLTDRNTMAGTISSDAKSTYTSTVTLHSAIKNALNRY